MTHKKNINEILETYHRTKDIKLKHFLIEYYAQLVKIVASRLKIHLVQGLELDDLIGYGVIGLVDAIEKYDPTKNIKFETYASVRIRGEILDSMRKADWAPRELRKNQKLITTTEKKLEEVLCRTPTDEEVMAELGLNKDSFLKIKDDINMLQMISLDDDTIKLNSKQLIDYSLENQIEKTSSLEVLKNALAQLPEREQMIIKLYYYNELTFKEIGEILNLSFSRVSQLHMLSMLKLKELIGKENISISF